MTKRKNNLTNIIISVLALLLVAAVIAIVLKFTNGLNEEFKTFYIEHNGKQIVATDSQMTFESGSEHRFNCKYISNPDNNTYNLRIVPNNDKNANFAYTVDGKSYLFSAVADLTNCFDIKRQNNYFIISFPEDFSIQSALSKLYPDKEVIVSDTIKFYEYYFSMHVSSYNNGINYYIDFNVYDLGYYTSAINEKEEQINQLTQQLNDLQNQLDNAELNNTSLTTQIAELNQKIKELQQTIEYYKKLDDELIELNRVSATFMYDNAIYDVQLYDSGDYVEIINPESTDSILFNGWTVNGELVDLSTFVITENTTFIADLTYFINVNFMINDEIYNSQKIVKGESIVLPDNPILDGYDFLGWSIDGETLVDVLTENIVDSANYVAVFKESSIDWFSQPAGMYDYESYSIIKTWDELISEKYLGYDSDGLYSIADNGERLGLFDNELNTRVFGILVIKSGIKLDDCALKNCVNLEEVYFPEGFSSLADACFYGCTSLKYVGLPSSLSDLGVLTFYKSGIKNFTFPSSISSNDFSNMFNSCPNLEWVDLSKVSFDVLSVGMFNACSSLEYIICNNAFSVDEYCLFGVSSNFKIYSYADVLSWSEKTHDSDSGFKLSQVYVYSESEPNSEGQFWHYVDDVPTPW